MPPDERESFSEMDIAVTSAQRAEFEGQSRAQVNDVGSKLIQAVQEMLSGFPSPGLPVVSPPPGEGTLKTLGELIEVPAPMTIYQSVAMLASLVRWLSAETGREESSVLDALAQNYRGNAQ